jgi:hypothetical protein
VIHWKFITACCHMHHAQRKRCHPSEGERSADLCSPLAWEGVGRRRGRTRQEHIRVNWIIAQIIKRLERELIVENYFEQANLFELGNYTTQVTYSSTSFTGQPQFNYRDAANNRTFVGEEISFRETEIGQLITVTLESGAADAPPVTFTLLFHPNEDFLEPVF